jgi:site-specific DNA-methyltransferase (adenine-specific)
VEVFVVEREAHMILNTILNGDTIAILKKIEDNSIDLIFADPPYWMRVSGVLKRVEGTDYDGCDDHWDNQFEVLDDYNDFTSKWLSECHRVLKPNGSIWVIGSMQCIYSIGAIIQNLGFWIINDVIWHKKNPTPNFMGTRLNNSHETLIWATKSEKSRYTFNYKTAKELNTDTVTEDKFMAGERKQLGSVWRIGVCQGSERLKNDNGEKLHNTQKPEELLRRIIAISSKLGDIVLDPFGGTMTTGAVAKKMGRNYIMIEREHEYCKYGETRLSNVVPEIGDVEKAVFDEKPIKVTLKEMIENDYLRVGELFYTKNYNSSAVLTENAKLLYENNELDIHTCAARARGSNSDRLNGFDIWYVVRGDKLTSLSDVRESYRERVLHKSIQEKKVDIEIEEVIEGKSKEQLILDL